MRSLAIAAFAAAAAFAGAVSTPAAAQDYPYCLQGRQQGYPGFCNFSSFQQCKAAASGTSADCGINPRFAFGMQRPYGGRYYHSRAQW
uniref:DUF3551 domain-containing protein n=1 Tax=Rhodopseudomonas palustris (strain BisA53) TaxID=316055 RepID=Q07MH4_RHOP5